MQPESFKQCCSEHIVNAASGAQTLRPEPTVTIGISSEKPMLTVSHTVIIHNILYPSPMQSCDCGDPPLCCPAGEREGAGDPEERDRRELEGASLWAHPRGTQPDTQWHGRGSVSDGVPTLQTHKVYLHSYMNVSDMCPFLLPLLQSWTRQRSWRGNAFAASSLEISHNTLQWCHASSRTVIWLVLKEASWAALLCPKYRQFFLRGPSPRESGSDCRWLTKASV